MRFLAPLTIDQAICEKVKPFSTSSANGVPINDSLPRLFKFMYRMIWPIIVAGIDKNTIAAKK